MATKTGRLVLTLVLEDLHEFRLRLLAPADLVHRDHLAIDDAEDRFDPEQGAQEGLRLTDPPTLAKKLEGVDQEKKLHPLANILEPSDDLVETQTAFDHPTRKHDEETQTHGIGFGVDDSNIGHSDTIGLQTQLSEFVGAVLGRFSCVLRGEGLLGRNVDRHDIARRHQTAVHFEEFTFSRRTRGGENVSALEHLVELVGQQIDSRPCRRYGRKQQRVERC